MAVRRQLQAAEFSSPAARTASRELAKAQSDSRQTACWPEPKSQDYFKFVLNSLWNEQVARLIADILDRSMQIMKLYPTSYSDALKMAFAEHIQVQFLSSSVSEEVGRILAQLLDKGILRRRDHQPLVTVISRHFRLQLLEEMAETYYRGVVLLKWNSVSRGKNLGQYIRKLKRLRFSHQESMKREITERGLCVPRRKKLPLDMKEIDNKQLSFNDLTYLCINSTHSEGDSAILGNHEYSRTNLIRYPKELSAGHAEEDSNLDISDLLEQRAVANKSKPRAHRDLAERLRQPQPELVFRRMTLVGKSFWGLKSLFAFRKQQEKTAIEHYTSQLEAQRHSIFRAMVSVVWLQQKNLLDNNSAEDLDVRT